MDIFDAQFSTGQVLAAAGMANPGLQTWIRRGMIVGHKDRPIDMPGSPGIRRTFTFHNVMEIATAKALVDVGAELIDAFRAAAMFAHTGDEERLPGLPFANDAYTLLCMAGDRSTVVEWEPGTDVLANIRHDLGRPLGFVILQVNPLFDRVTSSLGYHPEAVLDHVRKMEASR